jgi:hypothetical protein
LIKVSEKLISLANQRPQVLAKDVFECASLNVQTCFASLNQSSMEHQ